MLFAFAMSAVAWVFVLACSAATSTSPEIVLQTAWAAADVQATQGKIEAIKARAQERRRAFREVEALETPAFR